MDQVGLEFMMVPILKLSNNFHSLLFLSDFRCVYSLKPNVFTMHHINKFTVVVDPTLVITDW